jgi:hypothetical protein
MKRTNLGIVFGLVLCLGLIGMMQNSFAAPISLSSAGQLNLKYKIVAYDASTLRGITASTKSIGLELIVKNDSPYQIDTLTVAPAQFYGNPVLSIQNIPQGSIGRDDVANISAWTAGIITPFGTMRVPFGSGRSYPFSKVTTKNGIEVNISFNVTVKNNTTQPTFNYTFTTAEDELVYLPNN